MSSTLSFKRLFLASCIASSLALTGCIGEDDDTPSGPSDRAFTPVYNEFEVSGVNLGSAFFIPGRDYAIVELDFEAELPVGETIKSIQWEQTYGEYDIDIKYADKEYAYFSTYYLTDGDSQAYEFVVTVTTSEGRKSQAQSRYNLTKTFTISKDASVFAGPNRTIRRGEPIDLAAMVYTPDPDNNAFTNIQWEEVTSSGVDIPANDQLMTTVSTTDVSEGISEITFKATASFQGLEPIESTVTYTLTP